MWRWASVPLSLKWHDLRRRIPPYFVVVLAGRRLFRGFGALTLGGVLGVLITALGLLCFYAGTNAAWMLCGSLLCALFAWLFLREYHRKPDT